MKEENQEEPVNPDWDGKAAVKMMGGEHYV